MGASTYPQEHFFYRKYKKFENGVRTPVIPNIYVICEIKMLIMYK